MKKALVSIGLFLSVSAQAQNYVHQAIILNEGYFDYQTNEIIEPATIGKYDPVSQAYSVVDTLEGMRFASDLIIDGNFYYVAADSKIFKMDLNSHQEISSVSCPGVRNLGIYQNKLVATRGEYLTTYDSYLHVYDASTMTLIAAIDTVQGPKWATQNIVMDGTSAYIAVNNGYEWGNEKGIIGKLDLNALTYGNEIDLGPDGKNPDNLVKVGSFLYLVNNKDWSGASISKVALDGSSNSTVNIATASTGCGTSALRDDKLVYQISMETTLNEFDINVMNNVGPVSGHSLNYYELAQEPISGNLYASETDFFSFGKVHVFDASNNELSNFNAGISPGTIVFDVRSTSVNLNELASNITVYPNPTTDFLNVNSKGMKQVLDLNGKVLISSDLNNIDVSSLNSGIYFLEVEGKKVSFVKR
ncbi:MAG: T9SS C-terminal target domain-containing protein [Flavobacteriales bacterium]|nr:T9SS C-terminal target domain-containing protein [Flavobacteriales bacterium]